MTDEELADVLCEAYDKKPITWIHGVACDDDPATRSESRVRAHWLTVVREVRDRLEADKREQTAATLLAALIQAHVIANQNDTERCSDVRGYESSAVLMADALRAELAHKPDPETGSAGGDAPSGGRDGSGVG